MRPSDALFAAIAEYVTPHKQQRFAEILEQRTRRLTIVVENLFQPHNLAACIRSCDCFGVQDVHVIENEFEYETKRTVSLGAEQWVTLHRYRTEAENTRTALKRLKDAGYRLVATMPHENGTELERLPLNEPTALLFGTERDGLTETAVEMADSYMTIPMVGLTESVNVSVAVALCVHHLMWRLHRGEFGDDWHLTTDERRHLTFEWMLRNVAKHWPPLAKRLCEEHAFDPSPWLELPE